VYLFLQRVLPSVSTRNGPISWNAPIPNDEQPGPAQETNQCIPEVKLLQIIYEWGQMFHIFSDRENFLKTVKVENAGQEFYLH
jgi:hypothetical protein